LLALAVGVSRLFGAVGGIVARRAAIKSQRRDFVQNKFGFCPKGTANQDQNERNKK